LGTVQTNWKTTACLQRWN